MGEITCGRGKGCCEECLKTNVHCALLCEEGYVGDRERQGTSKHY